MVAIHTFQCNGEVELISKFSSISLWIPLRHFTLSFQDFIEKQIFQMQPAALFASCIMEFLSPNLKPSALNRGRRETIDVYLPEAIYDKLFSHDGIELFLGNVGAVIGPCSEKVVFWIIVKTFEKVYWKNLPRKPFNCDDNCPSSWN